MSIIFPLLLQVFLIFLNAVFACAEIAIISTNDAKVEKMVAEGNKKASKLLRLKENPAKFLATIQIAITLSGFLGSAFAADNFAGYLVDFMVKLGVANDESRAVFNSISVIVITLILSYFTLVFGELVPKRLAMKKSEGMALGMSGMLYTISKLFTPVVWLLTVSTNAVLRLFGVNPNEEDEEVSEEDIRLMVDASSEKGVIDVEEKEMIQNVFEFDDLSVDEFSTHRTEISFLRIEDTDEDWESTIIESSHSAFPVCGETVDDILGVIFAREYFRSKDKSKDYLMKNVMKPAYFVPSNLKADILFKQMNEKKLLHERLRTQEELMQSNYLLMLMKGRKVERYKNVIQITNGRKLVLVGIMIPFPEKKHNQQDEILIFTVDNIFSELVKDEKYYKIDDGQYLFYLFEVDENEGAWRKEALKKAEYLNQIMNAWWKQGLYIAVGKFEDKLEDISASYQDIMDEFRDRKLIGEAVVTDIQKKQKILSANQKLVERIREIIEEQYEDSNLNVTGIAQELGKTAKHISEVFKEETGESILYAINYKRITKAQALMRTGKYKLAEIPEMTGYSNMNTFRRNFKQIVGISPGKYIDNKEEQE